MKKILIFALTVGMMAPTCSSLAKAKKKKAVETEICTATQDSLLQMVEQALTNARTQSLIMAESLIDKPGRLPQNCTLEGKVGTSDCYWWCSGFFPGVLWMLYEDQPGNQQLRDYAELYTDRVEPVRNDKSQHDVGFMLNCSYGHAYRITGNPRYLPILSDGARNLTGRFMPKAGVTLSWGPSKRWKNPVIIDNMMNLELLEVVGKLEKNQKYLDVADSHAQTTMRNHFREDYSTFHVLDYDDQTGEVRQKKTAQGYSDESAWARGQAWALYGYTVMYRETRNPIYLEQARHIAHYLLGRSNWPEDMVPYWDFDCPDIPNTPRDASSASIMASALVELSVMDTVKNDSKRWLQTAQKMLISLSSPSYTAPTGTNGGFILLHSTGNIPGGTEIDVALTYADYYYVEALLRLKKLLVGTGERAQWVSNLTHIARPVLSHLAQGTLHKSMPYESSGEQKRQQVSYLEAGGRTICGIAPWLELGPDETPEGKLRDSYIRMTVEAISNMVNPKSPDYCCFQAVEGVTQPLVDAAFLAEGLLRAPTQLWGGLSKEAQQNVITEMKRSRSIKPYESNWLLFASTVEAFLLEVTGDCDMDRMMYGMDKFLKQDWYKGDAHYSDGQDFHLDYYNSLVIHPMLTDVLEVLKKHGKADEKLYAQQLARQTRFAAIMERLIAPDGTFPVVGRSVAYRFGCLHQLAQTALMKRLPQQLAPAQVRSAMTAAMNRIYGQDGIFHPAENWLTVGFGGHQPEIAEGYINTGSTYLATAGFLPLGLPASDPFWTGEAKPWTSTQIWGGAPVKADHAL